ncbi:MAG: hypothetical protein AB6733_10930 [Clostridiaceae bacterium]
MLKNLFLDTTKDEMEIALQMATEDIKFNRIMFKKKTSYNEMVSITNRCILALRKS